MIWQLHIQREGNMVSSYTPHDLNLCVNWVIIHPCLPADSVSVYVCYLCVLISISPFYSQVSGLDDGFLCPYIFINNMHLFQIPVCIESVMILTLKRTIVWFSSSFWKFLSKVFLCALVIISVFYLYWFKSIVSLPCLFP